MSAVATHRLLAVTTAAGLALSLATGVAAANQSNIAVHSPAGPAAAGLVRASSSLSTYWDQFSRSARPLTVTLAGGAGAGRAAARPQGLPVRIAGTTGSVTKSTASHALVMASGSVGSPWPGSSTSAPATTTGKVFFTDHTGGNWVCSGSLVNSAGKDLVITAGHCVYGTSGGEIPSGETWHHNWAFAPDYSNGNAPYGYWTARQMWTLNNYISNGDEQDDLGAVLLNSNSSGVKAVNMLGGQGIAWNYGTSQNVTVLGYPAAAPFNGQTLQYCDGTDGWDLFIWMEGLNCNLTGGASGGPWLISFNGQWGYVNSVNDARYSLYPSDMTGLYFGNNAANLYNTVANL